MKARVRWLCIAVAALGVLLYPWVFQRFTEARFAWAIDRAAGKNATDCGVATTKQDPGATVACVNQAIVQGRAFKASFRQFGMDAARATGLAASESGQVTAVRYDSNPGGFCLYLCRPTIQAAPCMQPVVEAKRFSPQIWEVAVRCAGESASRAATVSP